MSTVLSALGNGINPALGSPFISGESQGDTRADTSSNIDTDLYRYLDGLVLDPELATIDLSTEDFYAPDGVIDAHRVTRVAHNLGYVLARSKIPTVAHFDSLYGVFINPNSTPPIDVSSLTLLPYHLFALNLPKVTSNNLDSVSSVDRQVCEMGPCAVIADYAEVIEPHVMYEELHPKLRDFLGKLGPSRFSLLASELLHIRLPVRDTILDIVPPYAISMDNGIRYVQPLNFAQHPFLSHVHRSYKEYTANQQYQVLLARSLNPHGSPEIVSESDLIEYLDSDEGIRKGWVGRVFHGHREISSTNRLGSFPILVPGAKGGPSPLKLIREGNVPAEITSAIFHGHLAVDHTGTVSHSFDHLVDTKNLVDFLISEYDTPFDRAHAARLLLSGGVSLEDVQRYIR